MSEQEWEDKLAEVQKHSEHWYNKYKELENKIADIKANCDLAIEGRDVKIKELEQENNKLLDVINNQDVKIADLEEANRLLGERSNQLLKDKGDLTDKCRRLEQQIEKMKSALIDIKSNTDDVNIEWQIKYLFDELEIKENGI